MHSEGTGRRKKLDRETEAKVAEEQWTRYERARDNGHNDYLYMADRCNDFYIGEQWDPADEQALESQKRPALTINMILSTVNAVLGEQTSRRVEFKYKPRSGGTEDTATTLTKLVSAIRDANHYDWVESEVFADGIIQHGRGFFDIRVEFDDNLVGDIVIRSDDPREVILDPDAKEYDPTTWKEVFETRWMSVDEIEQIYGQDAADRIVNIGINNNRLSQDSVEYVREDTFGDARDKEEHTAWRQSDDEERTVRQVRVIERQHVRYEPCYSFVDLQTGDTKRAPNTWDMEKIEEFAARTGVGIVQKVEKKIRWTTTADRVVLHDDWSPYATFTKIPYFAYFRRGKPFGLVTNLISPQEQLNKLSSQELHILNTTANSGWIVEAGALNGMSADDLRDQGAETGLVIEMNPGRMSGLQKIEPNRPPTGIERAAIKSAQFIKEISGINEAMLGMEGAEVSGVALQEKTMRGQVQIAVPFDNLQRSRYFVARKLLELIQQFYTEPRVFNITTEGMKFEQKDEELAINLMTATGEVINDITVGKYEVTLSTMPAKDSFEDSQFAEALSLRQVGVAIPDDRIIEYSHLAKKFELAEEIRELTGRGEMTEEQMMQMQFQQEMQARLMVAEVAKAEAEVMKMEAESMKLAAEASMNQGGLDSPAFQMRREELEVELQKAREQLQLRRDLAALSARSRYDQSVLSTKGKIIQDRASQAEKRRTELVKGELNRQMEREKLAYQLNTQQRNPRNE